MSENKREEANRLYTDFDNLSAARSAFHRQLRLVLDEVGSGDIDPAVIGGAINQWHHWSRVVAETNISDLRNSIGAASLDRAEIVPLDVILFCPKCKAQHIDKAEPDVCESCGHPEAEHFGHKADDPDDIGCYACGGITKNGCQFFVAWLNPPHKKHRCHKCNHVWKPAMIQTNGVAAMEEGK